MVATWHTPVVEALSSPSLLGFRTGKVGPIEGASVEVASALTVLYGLNGSGKSSTLGALAASMGGRIDLPGTAVEFGVTHALVRVPTESDFLSPLVGYRMRRPVTIKRLKERVHSLWPQCPDDGIVSELTADVVVGLFPAGVGAPGWDVWLCSSDDQPNATSFRRKCIQSWHTNSSVVDLFSGADRDPNEWRALAKILGKKLGVADLGLRADLPETFLAGLLPETDRLHRAYLEAFGGRSELDYLSAASRLWSFGNNDDLPVPLVRLGWTDRLTLPVVDDVSIDVGKLTVRWVEQQAIAERRRMGLGPRWVEEDEESERDFDDHMGAPWIPGDPNSWFSGELDATVSRINEIYGDMLDGAPELTLVPGEYLDWMTGRPFRWQGDGFPLEQLSRAQQRWARISIGLGLSAGRGLIVIDEPEAALHRTAEGRMAHGLTQLAAEGYNVVVATHTPALINNPAGHKLRCIKENGRSTIVPLEKPDLQNLEDLGLQPSDLLGGVRIFVLVEGQHDEQVLQHFLSPQLEEASAHLLPVDGASKLASAVDGSLLLSYTRAPILAVLDNDQARELEDLKETCVGVAVTKGLPAAQALVDDLKRHGTLTAEARFVADFVITGLKRGVIERLHIHGLSKPDILWYLPTNAIMRTEKTWEQLHQEHLKASDGKRAKFKTFLRNSRGADLEPESIRKALKATHETPADFANLGDRIIQLAERAY